MDKRIFQSMTPEELAGIIAPFLNTRENASLLSAFNSRTMTSKFTDGYGLNIRRGEDHYDFAISRGNDFIRIRAEFTERGAYQKPARLHIKAVELGHTQKSQKAPFMDEDVVTHRFIPPHGPAAHDTYDDGAQNATLTADRLERVKAGLGHLSNSSHLDGSLNKAALDTIFDPAETDRIPAIGPYQHSAAHLKNPAREKARRRRNLRQSRGY